MSYAIKFQDGRWLGGYTLGGPIFVESIDEATRFHDFSSAAWELNADPSLAGGQVEVIDR